METVWSLDFCLTCDRQTGGEAYCSQACRLADLDALASPTRSEPSSPTPLTTSTSTLPPAPSPTAGFFLPPAFDFAAYRRPTPPPTSSRPSSSGSSSAAAVPSDASTASSSHIFTPASGRSVHGSFGQAPSPRQQQEEGLSTQTKSELREYINSFDTVRRFKCRLTG